MNTMLLIGPASCGKTVLARQIHRGLRPLSDKQRQRIATAYEGSNLEPPEHDRPFRAPHHTVGPSGMFGRHVNYKTAAQSTPRYRPGEFQLAACGTLFLDELPEFTTKVIGELCAMEQHPSNPTLLIASTNLCPCGMLGIGDNATQGGRHVCKCSTEQIERYQERVVPFLDAFEPVVLNLSLPPAGLRGSEFLNGRLLVHGGGA